MKKERDKVKFELVPDTDGYPPFHIENVWVSSTAIQLQYVVDNVPFFATQATLGDIIDARRTPDGLVFDKLVSRSLNSLIRIIVYKTEKTKEIRARLKTMGCSTEEFKGRPLLALNVPATTKLADVQAYLDDLGREDIAEYEETLLRQ